MEKDGKGKEETLKKVDLVNIVVIVVRVRMWMMAYRLR